MLRKFFKWTKIWHLLGFVLVLLSTVTNRKAFLPPTALQTVEEIAQLSWVYSFVHSWLHTEHLQDIRPRGHSREQGSLMLPSEACRLYKKPATKLAVTIKHAQDLDWPEQEARPLPNMGSGKSSGGDLSVVRWRGTGSKILKWSFKENWESFAHFPVLVCLLGNAALWGVGGRVGGQCRGQEEASG